MTLVCLMTITMNANAQNMTSLKQGAVNFIRENCKAPSTFILTNKLGIKIPTQSIKCETIKEHETYDSMYVYGTVIDSIIVCKHNLGEDPFHYRVENSISISLETGIYIGSLPKPRLTKREAGFSFGLWEKEIIKERNKEIRVDSFTFANSYKFAFRDTLVYKHKDKIIGKKYMKYNYNTTYRFCFYYEAQNSMGGLVQNFAEVNYDTKTKEYYIGNELKYSETCVGTKKFKKIKPKTIYSFLKGIKE